MYSVLLYIDSPSRMDSKERGLAARNRNFWIDGRATRLFSGAMHYFRIPREYWRDRLVKLRSSGCNVVETLVFVLCDYNYLIWQDLLADISWQFQLYSLEHTWTSARFVWLWLRPVGCKSIHKNGWRVWSVCDSSPGSIYLLRVGSWWSTQVQIILHYKPVTIM